MTPRLTRPILLSAALNGDSIDFGFTRLAKVIPKQPGEPQSPVSR